MYLTGGDQNVVEGKEVCILLTYRLYEVLEDAEKERLD
jgi:hypothetical protein